MDTVTAVMPADFITPTDPVLSIGTRYFVRPRIVAHKAGRMRKWHGIAGGCSSARAAFSRGQAAYEWEQEVWRDAEGVHWVADPSAVGNGLNGWRPTLPCAYCGDDDLDSLLAERDKWEHDGACYGLWTEYDFFALGEKGQAECRRLCDGGLSIAEARTYPRCPVRDECRDYGQRLHDLTPGGIPGMLGGVTEQERREQA